MKSIKKIALFFLLTICPLTAFADDASAQLTQILSNLNTLQADFVQTVYDGNGNVLQKTSGQMSLQRPGKFRWEVSSPARQLLVADGQRVWFYDKELAQVTVQKQKSDNRNSPAMLLSGSPEQLSKTFSITLLNTSDATQNIFKLTPKSTNDLFQSVQLSFSDGQLQTMRLMDSLQQATVIDFSHVQNNPSLAPSLFTFVAPIGVDVVSQ